jgi:hypothetical protein
MRGVNMNDRRPCGCPEDYHLSDCPILTSRYEDEDPGDLQDRFYDGDYGGWN